LKTLSVRVQRQNETALRIAQYLEGHERVKRVFYPGLESHPDHKTAIEQMSGFGGLISFEIDGGLDCAQRFVHELELPYLAPSLGGVETLVSHPATVSYYDLSREERLSLGITDELVRYAAGVEDVEDLIADIEQALGKI
jgi:cystathionine gamma-synthase